MSDKFIFNKLTSLVFELNARDLEDKIEWDETEIMDVFQHDSSQYLILIGYTPANSDTEAPTFTISVKNSENENLLIEQIVDISFKGDLDYDLVRNLYMSARRKALGIENALDIIIDYLKAL